MDDCQPSQCLPADRSLIGALQKFDVRVLVVDDDNNIKRLNAEVLQMHGYQTGLAEDGAVAWELLRREKFSLVVTDHNMPNLSGVELIKKMRDGGLFIPVILSSGSSFQTLGLNFRYQPLALLSKPFSPEALVKLVEELLSVSIQQKDNEYPSGKTGQDKAN